METIMSSVSIDRLAVARKAGAVLIVVSSSLLTAGVASSSSIDGKNAAQQVALHARATNATNATSIDWKMIARRTFRRQQCAILGEDWCGGRAH
jgi:hypothetical protein